MATGLAGPGLVKLLYAKSRKKLSFLKKLSFYSALAQGKLLSLIF